MPFPVATSSNRAYRVVTHNTPSPMDLAQMAHTWRDAIYQSKSMAKHLRKMRLATSLCEPVMPMYAPVCDNPIFAELHAWLKHVFAP